MAKNNQQHLINLDTECTGSAASCAWFVLVNNHLKHSQLYYITPEFIVPLIGNALFV